MSTSREERPDSDPEEWLAIVVPLKVFGLATAYAATLSYLERRYPIKPDHIWAEVTGGVLISLIPVALFARRIEQLDWRLYEGAIWRSFIASGTPIILWQLGESILRHMELLSYTLRRERTHVETYADDTTPLALRGRDRARSGPPCD